MVDSDLLRGCANQFRSETFRSIDAGRKTNRHMSDVHALHRVCREED